MATKKQIDKEIKGLIKAAQAAGDANAAAVIRLLEDARKEIAAAVATTEWQMYRLPQLKAAVERALREFASKFGRQLGISQRDLWQLGVDLVDVPIRRAGVIVAMPEIDTAALNALQTFGLEKVQGLASSAIDRINTELSMGLIGAKSPYDVMQAIGADPGLKGGIFENVAKRAETITLNESGRALEKASQERKEAAAKVVPGLQKQWYYGHSPRMPRITHVIANRQIRDVDKPYNVGGEELMFPRDPKGSPGNTINCG